MMSTETTLQVCNEGGEQFDPALSPSKSATNPLCSYHYGNHRAAMNGHGYNLRSAILDRCDGLGLMAKMSDERFARYIAKELAALEEQRSHLL